MIKQSMLDDKTTSRYTIINTLVLYNTLKQWFPYNIWH